MAGHMTGVSNSHLPSPLPSLHSSPRHSVVADMASASSPTVSTSSISSMAALAVGLAASMQIDELVLEVFGVERVCSAAQTPYL